MQKRAPARALKQGKGVRASTHGTTALRRRCSSLPGRTPTTLKGCARISCTSLDPQSALEFELMERLAGILWRLRRVPFFEAAIIDARQAQLDCEAKRTDFRTPCRTPQE